ncbi:MAG: glutamate 5-kinase [Desulfobacterales bacterium]|nr:glutamate 5-kinase [Desulfobacterales bacterium]
MTSGDDQRKGIGLRRAYLARARRVVVKVGSAVLTNADGLDQGVIEELARGLLFLRESGCEVILVSSGAVAAGRKRLGRTGAGNVSLKEKQAFAALGQSSLMRVYEDIFNKSGRKVAQVLLTHNDLANRNRYLNIRNTMLTLLDWGILPIVNENDTVSVEELRFGDNDTLAAMITNVIEADMLICLTDVDGLYTGNPRLDPRAEPVYTVTRVDKKVEKMAGHLVGALGMGGMRSKIRAARMVAARGGSSFIGSGRQPGILQQLFAGDPVGTFFLPRAEKMQGRKHWIAYVLRPKGDLVLDQGACRAVVKGGKSLLPSGIKEVRGKFRRGESVQCLDESNQLIAVGLVDYGSADLVRIQGVKTSRIEEVLGYKNGDEVIHRDNLVIM